jgi:hypothetical protein
MASSKAFSPSAKAMERVIMKARMGCLFMIQG